MCSQDNFIYLLIMHVMRGDEAKTYKDKRS